MVVTVIVAGPQWTCSNRLLGHHVECPQELDFKHNDLQDEGVINI